MPAIRSPTTDSSFGFDPSQLEELCTADLDRLREALRALRDQRASGAFLELEKAAGIRQGELSRFLDGHRDLHCGQVLELIRLLREDPAAFYGRVYPRKSSQHSPSGLLRRLIPRPAREEPSDWSSRLLSWSRDVEISESGAPFPFDPAELEAKRNADFDDCERAGIGALECFITLQSSLATDSAPSLIRWIANLAYMQRIRGRHPVAAELFDVAMQLAEQVGDKAGLSLVCRNACYLLSDWGYFDEAGDFAERAIALATAVKDLPGIGLSHHAYGVISTNRDRNELAEEMYRTSLLYLEAEQLDAMANTKLSLAMLYLAQGAIGHAAIELSEIADETRDRLATPTRARVALGCAELESQRGKLRESEERFEEAESLFARIPSISDVAFVRLFRIRSLLRLGERRQAKSRALELIKLSGDTRLDKKGRAILGEVARQIHQEHRPIEFLQLSIAKWRRVPRSVWV